LQAGIGTLTKLVAQSGRVIEIATPTSERLAAPAKIAPGAPPLVQLPAVRRQNAPPLQQSGSGVG